MATLSKLIITSFLPLIVFISPAICQSTDEVVDAYFLIDQGKEARDSDVVLKIIQLEIQGRQKEFRSQLKNLYGNKKVKPSKALLIEALYFNTIARDTALANSAILRYRSQFPSSLTGHLLADKVLDRTKQRSKGRKTTSNNSR